jgi:hypothetical protein
MVAAKNPAAAIVLRCFTVLSPVFGMRRELPTYVLVNVVTEPFSRRVSERCIVGLALKGGTAAGARLGLTRSRSMKVA